MVKQIGWFGLGLIFMLSGGIQAAETKNWTERLKLSGDFRYRHELISEEKFGSPDNLRVPDRNRQRLRLRVMLQAEVNPQMDVIARLASGVGEPVSTNQDLSGGFSQKQIWIDRAYLDYHPSDRLWGHAGKFALPFEATDLIWDPDLNPEGLAVGSVLKMDQHELFFRLGGLWASERKSADGPDQGLFGAQLGGHAVSGKTTGMLGIAYYDYGNVQNGPTIYSTTKGFGNSVYSDGSRLLYRNDYNLFDATGEMKTKLGTTELSALGELVMNTAAEPDSGSDKKNGTGWLAGLAFKFRKLPFDWSLAYNYRDLQANAAIGAFVDSDAGGGSTNFNGHKISIAVTPLTKTKFGVTYFRNTLDPDGAKLAYNRLQVDFEAKF